MSPKPAELELKILSVLWEHGELTVREVLEKIPGDRNRAYTTILSTMQVMEKKGFLDRHPRGNAHVYRPLMERDAVMKPMMGQLLRSVFGGRPSAMLQCLLDDEDVADDELKQIRRLIRQHAEKNKGEKGGNA